MDIFNFKFFEMQAYGFSEIIKTYCDFPKSLPLPAHIEHGWTALTNPLPSDLKAANSKGLMLVLNERRKKEWVSSSKIPCEIVGAPFIHYRQSQNIKKSNTAQGTIFFPAHSTKNVDSNYNIHKLIFELNTLPEEYKPITICMHPEDYNSPLKKYFEKEDFLVTSAGDKKTKGFDFVNNFYNILSKHRFAASNEIGSHLFYAIEMNIPFFLMGETPIWKNKRDKNVPENYTLENLGIGAFTRNLFNTGPTNKISLNQQEFVSSELGMNHCLSPIKLKETLMQNYKKNNYSLKAKPAYYLYKLVKKII